MEAWTQKEGRARFGRASGVSTGTKYQQDKGVATAYPERLVRARGEVLVSILGKFLDHPDVRTLARAPSPYSQTRGHRYACISKTGQSSPETTLYAESHRYRRVGPRSACCINCLIMRDRRPSAQGEMLV